MKTLTKSVILETLKSQKNILRDNFKVSKIGLFGSFARDEANENSDLDFLVEFSVVDENYISNRFALIDFLTELFQREVDVANPKSLKPYCREQILNQAVYA